jgi:hypothetical protein
MATTKAGPLLPIAISATGVTVVPTGELVLLPGLESGVLDATVATFVTLPPVGAVTVKVRLVPTPAARLTNAQFTTPALFVPPPLALTKVTFVGKTSLGMMLLAVAKPEFVTDIV